MAHLFAFDHFFTASCSARQAAEARSEFLRYYGGPNGAQERLARLPFTFDAHESSSLRGGAFRLRLSTRPGKGAHATGPRGLHALLWFAVAVGAESLAKEGQEPFVVTRVQSPSGESETLTYTLDYDACAVYDPSGAPLPLARDAMACAFLPATHPLSIYNEERVRADG